MTIAIWNQPQHIQWSQCLLRSYQHWLKSDLLYSLPSVDHDPVDHAKALFFAPFVVVSHGTEADPILNYGNQAALDLWEMDWDTLIQTPSRLTAEPVYQAARSQMLDQLHTQGFITNYDSIRISSTGRRFWMKGATVWNLIDDSGNYCGQAATFSQWSFL